MGNMSTYKFNTEPAPDTECEECGSVDNVLWCDSDLPHNGGKLNMALCPNCIDPDYDPDSDD